MKRYTVAYQIWLLINLACPLNLLAKTTKEKSVVIEITNQAELNANVPAVLEFYSENCGACIMFKKQYERIAQKHPNINFLKIDGVKNHALVKKYKITAFPSFVFMPNETVTNPDIVVGPKKHDIETAIKKIIAQLEQSTKKTTSIQTVQSLNDLDKLISNANQPVVVKYQADWCGACKMFAPKFLEIANQYNDTAIFVNLNDETAQGQEFAKKHDLKSLPTTLIFTKQQPNKPVVTIVGGDKDRLIKEIQQLCQKSKTTPTNLTSGKGTNSIEIIEIKNKAQFDDLIQKTTVPVVIDYHAEGWCGACKIYKDVFTSLAQQFPQLKFAKVDGQLPENRIIGETYNIQKLPTTLVFENGKKTHAIEGISLQLNTILHNLCRKS